VTLIGSVRSGQERTKAEDIVRGVAGVLGIDIRLVVSERSVT